MLTGYKTYIIAAVLLIGAALKFANIEIPGFTDHADAGSLLTVALGLVFARNGAKTEVKKLDE